MELSEFITARLDEDEAAAKAGARRVGMPWRAEPQPGTPGGLVLDEIGLVGSTGGLYAAEHIARHDPARVLREIEAKRAIVREWQAVRKLMDLTDGNVDGYRDWVLRHLATAWSDHPDYDPQWHA